MKGQTDLVFKPSYLRLNLQRVHLLLLPMSFIILAAISILLITITPTKPEYYNAICILPTIFILSSFLCFDIYKHIPENLAVFLIVFLMFVRTVVAPVFFVLGGFPETITLNVDVNTPQAIALVCYETLAVFITIRFYLAFKKKHAIKVELYPLNNVKTIKIKRSFITVIFCLILCCFVFYLIAPEILQLYRTIFSINKKNFTHLEAAGIIDQYGTTWLKKFSLVTFILIFNILRLLIPLIVIIFIKNKCKEKSGLLISCLFSLTPLLVVDDTIARSIYFALILFVFTFLLYGRFNFKNIIRCVLVGGLAVVIYFIIRFVVNLDDSSNENIFAFFGKTFSEYFSGINVISGVFNLPSSFSVRTHYFFYDILKSIPFGNTIFNLQSNDVSQFFNSANLTGGQIPATIGMSYFYFGSIGAPLYSVFFTLLACGSWNKLLRTKNAITKGICIYFVVVLSMSFTMYNIQITYYNLIEIGLPMVLLNGLFNRSRGEKQNVA